MENNLVSGIELKLNCLIKKQSDGFDLAFSGKSSSTLFENSKINLYLALIEQLNFIELKPNFFFINHKNNLDILKGSFIYDFQSEIDITITQKSNKMIIFKESYSIKEILKSHPIKTSPEEAYSIKIKNKFNQEMLKVVNLVVKSNHKRLTFEKKHACRSYAETLLKIKKPDHYFMYRRLKLFGLTKTELLKNCSTDGISSFLEEKMDLFFKKNNINTIESIFFFIHNFNNLEMTNYKLVSKMKKIHLDIINNQDLVDFFPKNNTFKKQGGIYES